jgi:methionine--tRNA ligase beta chain
VVYVWVDALFNYITALGYCNDRYDDYDKYWPADVHIVGKEIVRFHSIIWPAMLMSMDMPLPKKVFGHGWLLLDGGKMSKSKGNVVDPYLLAERYGVDALRFFLLRTFPFGTDGNFSNELLINPSTRPRQRPGQPALPHHRHGGQVLRRHPARGADSRAADDELLDGGRLRGPLRGRYMESFAPQNALDEVFKVIQRANKYIDETAPWALARDPPHRRGQGLAELEALEAEQKAAAEAAAHPALEFEPQLPETVDFDTFARSDFRVVKVKACDAVPKSKKLLRFTLDDGTGTDRQILSGIHVGMSRRPWWARRWSAIVNLPPRKMMGLESNGMLLSAVHTEHGEEKLNLIMVDDAIPAGAKLC